jgi:hypothetical protein
LNKISELVLVFYDNMKEQLSRRDFLKLAALGLLTACAPKNVLKTDLHEADTQIPPTDYPTPIPNIPDSPTQLPPSPEPEVPLEQRFILGGVDFTNTPFSAVFADDLRSLMSDASGKMTADLPLPVTSPSFGTDVQNSRFDQGAWFRPEGHPYFVVITDRPNHLLIYAHSAITGAMGELARRVTSFVMLNPDKADQVIGKHIELNFNEFDTTGEIVHAGILSNEQFFAPNGFGSYEEGVAVSLPKNVLFARTDQLGIPDQIRNDQSDDTYYLVFASCQSRDGKKYLTRNENIAQKAVVVVKVKLP